MTAIRVMKRHVPRPTLSVGALSEQKHGAMKSKFASPSDVNFSTIRNTENLGRQNWTSKMKENCINMIAAKLDEQAKNQNDMKQRIDMLDAKMANIRKDVTDYLEPSTAPK